MGKVKKAGAVRKAGKSSKKAPTKQSKTSSKPAKTSKKAVRAAKRPAKRSTQGRSKPRARSASPLPDSPSFHVRELDPIDKCGPGTSVQHLYRVDESNGGVPRPHLVFFDRHGWYCEHGRTCPAVAHAQRHARKAGVIVRHQGPT